MHNILSILKYELKMQLKNAWLWMVVAFATGVTLCDTFPSAANMSRLAYLADQGYVVLRLLAHGGVLLLFGAMFILSGRIRGDIRRGTIELLSACPLRKHEYIWGKFLGSYAATLLALALYLVVNALVHWAWNPGPFSPVPYGVGFFAMSVPACFFVSASTVAFPVVVDIRLFYTVFSVYFLINSGFIYTENSILQSLFLFQKEMLKLVYTFDGFDSIAVSRLLGNLAFLLCAGAGSLLLLQGNKRFWREVP